jgi:GNAT superfamily N-acetyltransferase
MDPIVRPGLPAERERMQQIEIAAGARFAEVGLAHVAAHDPFGLDELAEYLAAGRCWVVEAEGEVAGYALADVVGECAHLEQVSVVPEQQGRGLGGTLVDHVVAWAADRGFPAVTLTTYRAVPWNAPLYERLGFRVLADDEITPALRAVVAVEVEHGLDPAERVCMRREVMAARRV